MKIPAYAYDIALDPRTLSALEAYSMPNEQSAELKKLFYADFNAFVEQAKQLDDPDLGVLGLCLIWGEDMLARYAGLGIPREIAMDNVRDMQIWSDDYLAKYGRPGFCHWDWVAMSLKLEVIRLGRLQFQPTKLPKDVILNGEMLAAGTDILAVHIPAGEPLAPEAVRDSFLRAPGFFKKYFGSEYEVYHCHSWLLSPVLGELLKEGSAILRFQQNFFIYESDPSRQAEERVFGIVSDDFPGYPENTSLQRSLKKHLLAGKTVPAGAGVGLFGGIE